MKSSKSANKYRTYLLAFIIIELFLFSFFPANRIEVDDAFWYAGSIRDYAYIDLFNPRFFLFLPLVKSIYDTILLLGINIDAYYFLCVVSAIFSGLTLLLLYDTLGKYLKFERWPALFVVALLGVSYEFWRYSMEAEVYIVAMFFVLLTLRLFLKWEQDNSLRNLVWLSLIASITTLIYKPSFIPVYLIFSLLFFYHKKYFHFIIYNAVGAFIIIGSFFIVYLQMTSETTFSGYLFGGANEPVGGPAGAIFVIASNMLSVLWLFGWEPAASFIIEHFPHKVVEEEMFLALQVADLLYLLFVVWLGIAASFTFLVINAIKNRLQYSKKRVKILSIILLWMLIYSGFLLFMDPTSNEPWLMIQIPLVIIFGAFLIEPLKKSRLWVAFTFLFLVFINNTLGGVGLLSDQRYDYYRQKSEWLKINASADDHIVTYGPMSLIRYLRYYTPAEVINLEEDKDKAFKLFRNAEKVRGDIYFPEDIFHPPQAILYRAKIDLEELTELFQLHSYSLQRVAGEEEGKFKTYRLVIR